jgi:hypothetical protein
MAISRVLTAAIIIAAGLSGAARAEDDFAGSFRLRGGYDTNPEFAGRSGIGGSAFIGTETALIAGTKEAGYTAGVAAEAGTIHYANPAATPTLSGKLILRGKIGDDDASLSSTTTISDISSYNLRSSDLVESLKGEAKTGALKVFATAEVARSSLNQSNAIFQDFLPKPQQFLRTTLIPGLSVVAGKAEAGVSVNLSTRRYTEYLDDFGYRRDNERVQPFVFAKYDGGDISGAVAISQLYGWWHDPDFSRVNRFLFEANASWRPKPFSIELAASRRAGETTFPISPITIDTLYNLKASWQVDPALMLVGNVAYADSEFLDSPYRSRTFTMGLGLQHDVSKDLTWGVDLTCASGRLISGDRARAIIIASSLTKRFTTDSKNVSHDKTLHGS